MLRSPKYANHSVFLESSRQARAFQDGGSTIANNIPVPPQIVQDQEVLLKKLTSIEQILQEWTKKL
jgi:hypothetical protein